MLYQAEWICSSKFYFWNKKYLEPYSSNSIFNMPGKKEAASST